MRVLLDENLPHDLMGLLIAQLPFGVILLVAPSNRVVHLRPLVPEILRVLPVVTAGSLQVVNNRGDS